MAHFLVPAVQLVEVLQRLYVSLSKTATWMLLVIHVCSPTILAK